MNERFYIHEIKGEYSSICRNATDIEVKNALIIEEEREKLKSIIKETEKQLNNLNENCTHQVCYDEPGYLHDLRTCVACGNVDLI